MHTTIILKARDRAPRFYITKKQCFSEIFGQCPLHKNPLQIMAKDIAISVANSQRMQAPMASADPIAVIVSRLRSSYRTYVS